MRRLTADSHSQFAKYQRGLRAHSRPVLAILMRAVHLAFRTQKRNKNDLFAISGAEECVDGKGETRRRARISKSEKKREKIVHDFRRVLVKIENFASSLLSRAKN
jgi:hypothetical protein